MYTPFAFARNSSVPVFSALIPAGANYLRCWRMEYFQHRYQNNGADPWYVRTLFLGLVHFHSGITYGKEIANQGCLEGRALPRTTKAIEAIQNALAVYKEGDKLTEEWELAQIEEMMVLSCMACPKETTIRQRAKFFPQTHFRGLGELIHDAMEVYLV